MSQNTQPLNPALVTLTALHSTAAEQYRALRTNLEFLSVTQRIRAVQVTSGVPGAGKTLTAANLAIVMAQAERRVLLVDADLRRPAIHHLFPNSHVSGLTTALTRADSWEQYLYPGPLPNLWIMASGSIPPNPAELVGSTAMGNLIQTFQSEYDFVVLDTPPVVAYTDAVALSRLVDGTIFVIRSEFASRQADLKAKERLEQVNARILGVVLNALDLRGDKTSAYYYGYGEKTP